MARSWNPEFKHSDRERWICVYPCYINSKKTLAEGRKVPKLKAIENPTHSEIKDVCAAAGLKLGVENKVHPREQDARDARFRGRIRIELKNDDGTPVLEQFQTRQSVLLYICDTVPKLKSRQQSGSAPSSSSQPAGGASGGKKKKNKKNK